MYQVFIVNEYGRTSYQSNFIPTIDEDELCILKNLNDNSIKYWNGQEFCLQDNLNQEFTEYYRENKCL